MLQSFLFSFCSFCLFLNNIPFFIISNQNKEDYFINTYFESEINSLENQLSKIENDLKNYPEGELFIYGNMGKYSRWYIEKEEKKEYLPRTEYKLATALAHKKLISLKRDCISAKIKGLKSYFRIISKPNEKLTKFISHPEYNALIQAENSIHSSWVLEKYNRCPNHPEQLSFTCPSGNQVRSKSEVFIDMVLNQHHIPYRYECELPIGKTIFYPDFTIKHPLTDELIYWEHFGLMDDKSYSQNAYGKLQLYSDNGIIPGKNLIVTFETRKNPFSYSDAEAALTQLHL